MSDASRPRRPAQQARRRPFHLIDLMALVAAIALTLAIPRAFMPLIRSAFSGADWRERLIDQTSLALIFWTPFIALLGGRSQLRRASRSYGPSGVLAAAAALLLRVLQNLLWAILQYRRGTPLFPEGGFRGGGYFFCPAAARFVLDAPESAAAAIVAVWSILALARAGRASSDWSERFCLLFGLFWVLWYFGRDLMLLFR